MANTDYGVLLALRDQLRTYIVGSTGYNSALDDLQIELGHREPDQAPVLPFVCISVASGNRSPSDLSHDDTVTLDTTLFGYVKANEPDTAFQEALYLLSDVLAALAEDYTIGNRVAGLTVSWGVGNSEEDQLGVVRVDLSMKYFT